MEREAALHEISALALIAPKDHLVSALSHDLRDADRGRLVACAVPSQEQIPHHPGSIGHHATCGKKAALLAFFGPGGFLSPETDLEGIVAKRLVDSHAPGSTTWWKILNRAYSQKVGRSDLFGRG